MRTIRTFNRVHVSPRAAGFIAKRAEVNVVNAEGMTKREDRNICAEASLWDERVNEKALAFAGLLRGRRTPYNERMKCECIRHSSFGIVSSFVIRPSSFCRS
jgi:hypothetical protein